MAGKWSLGQTNAWTLRWNHWPYENDYFIQLFHNRKDAMDYAIQFMFDEKTRSEVSRRTLWRRCKRNGLEVVKVHLERGWK